MIPHALSADMSERYINLVLLELCFQRPVHSGQKVPVGVEMSPFTFPNLCEMSLTSNAEHRLVLDGAHYPKLGKLAVQSPWQQGALSALQLQLPSLHTLQLTSVVVQSACVLTACLSPLACPVLRNFFAADITFKDEELKAMDVNAPWLEHFEIRKVDIVTLCLKVPRLLNLRLIDCSTLKGVTLLPDGDPPVINTLTQAANCAPTVPACTLQQRVHKKWDGLPGMGSSRICLPCADLRIDLLVRKLGIFQHSQSFNNLRHDLRIRDVMDLWFQRLWGCLYLSWWFVAFRL